MAQRIKPMAVIIGDLKQAEAALAEMAELGRGVALHTVEMNEEIDAAKAKAKAACAPLEARSKELAAALAAFAEQNKAELFKKSKSLDLGFGIIGFRISRAIKTVAKSVTWEMVLQQIKNFGFREAVRVQESVDKDALHTWPAERLATIGVKIEVTDVFYIEIAKEQPKAAV